VRIGIDVGGTKIEGLALDGSEEIARLRVATPQHDYAATVKAIAGVVESAGQTGLHELPRLAWDGRLRSLRAMRVMLSGAMFGAAKRRRAAAL